MDNGFEGSLPSGMSLLTALNGISMENNFFTGQLPDLPSTVQFFYAQNNRWVAAGLVGRGIAAGGWVRGACTNGMFFF